jgi:hypothetical protein
MNKGTSYGLGIGEGDWRGGHSADYLCEIVTVRADDSRGSSG